MLSIRSAIRSALHGQGDTELIGSYMLVQRNVPGGPYAAPAQTLVQRATDALWPTIRIACNKSSGGEEEHQGYRPRVRRLRSDAGTKGKRTYTCSKVADVGKRKLLVGKLAKRSSLKLRKLKLEVKEAISANDILAD